MIDHDTKSPLIGRIEQLKDLTEKFNLSKKGNGKLILIEGSPGIGKTYLVNEFISKIAAEEKDLFFRRLELDPNYQNGSFYALELLISKVLIEDEAKKELNKKIASTANDIMKIGSILLPLIPVIGDVASALVSTISMLHGEFKDDIKKYKDEEKLLGPPKIAKRAEKAFEFFTEITKKIKPVIILIDDLHWIDNSSISVLSELIQKISTIPLLLIGTYRPEELAFRKDIKGIFKNSILPYRKDENQYVKRLKLRPFTIADTKAQIGQLYTNNNFDNDFIGKIQDITEGNPLFVEELMKLLKSKGIVTETKGYYKRIQNIDYNELPQKLPMAIWRRVEALKTNDPEAFRLHSRSSTFGQTFTPHQVHILEQDSNILDIMTRLSEVAKDHYFIKHKESSQDTSYYAFLHALIHQTFQEYLKENHRDIYTDYHRYAANDLEKNYETKGDNRNLATMAFHFEQAGNHEKALLYYKQAGKFNETKQAYYESFSLYDTAYKIMNATSIGTTLDEFEINFGLGKTFEILGNKEAAIKKLEMAVHSAGELEKPLVLAQALTHLGISLLQAGKFDKSFENLEKARQIYDSHKDTLSGEDKNAYILCLNWNGINYRERKKWESAGKCHDKAIHYAEQVGNNRLKAHALANIGAIFLRQNEFEAVLEKWEQALKIAIDDNDRPWVAHYSIDVGFLCFLLDKYSDAMENLDRGIKIARKDFYEDNIARGLMNMGSVDFAKGNLNKAESYYSEALGIAEKNNVVRLIWRLEHNIGNIFKKREKYLEAEKRYLNAIEIIEKMLKEYTDQEQKLGFISHRLNAFRSLILLYCQEKRYDDAHTIAERGLDNSLKAFLKRRIDEIALKNDDDCIKNKNFKKGLFIETE